MLLHQVAPHADLSTDDLPLGAIVGPPHRRPPKRLRIGRARHRELAGVHRAVEARDRNAGRGFPTLGDLRWQWRSGDSDRTQRFRKAERVIQHPDHVGRHTDHHGSPGRGRDVETMLRGPVRLPEHDQRCSNPKAVEAHAADALGQRCHG